MPKVRNIHPDKIKPIKLFKHGERELKLSVPVLCKIVFDGGYYIASSDGFTARGGGKTVDDAVSDFMRVWLDNYYYLIDKSVFKMKKHEKEEKALYFSVIKGGWA
jgi:hypothetical protein